MGKWYDANGVDVDAYPDRAFRGGVYNGGIFGKDYKVIKETLCPVCKSRMKPMNGKFGKYWKCIILGCTGTRDSMGRSKEEYKRDRDDENELDRMSGED